MLETRNRCEPEHPSQREIDVGRRVRWWLGAFLVLLAAAAWLLSPALRSELVGHAAASSVCFVLARRLGRRRVESLITKRGLGAADSWLARWGPHAVFLTRLVPGISFDGISYAAGLTSISFTHFLVATTLGVIPETLLFAYLGHSVHEQAPLVMGISFAVGLSGLVAALLLGRSKKGEPQ